METPTQVNGIITHLMDMANIIIPLQNPSIVENGRKVFKMVMDYTKVQISHTMENGKRDGWMVMAYCILKTRTNMKGQYMKI